MNCTTRRNFLAVTSAWLFTGTSTSFAKDIESMKIPQILDINKSPLVPWVNGKGLRRELLQQDLSATGKPNEYGWRVGTAYVTGDAPFSALPGIDRWITLVDGDGFRMESTDPRANHVLSKPLEPHFFPGEAPVDSKLIGSRTEVFNVLVKRGMFAADVKKLESGTVAKSPSTLLVYCTHGRLALTAGDDHGHELTPGQAAIWQHGSPELIVNLTQNNSAGLVVRIAPVVG
jgi:environmental stress-induced protein Ves